MSVNAYIYQAALYCKDCARDIGNDLRDEGVIIEDTEDSDEWPQGPYPDGGGEADTPQHCDACGRFLENPLTTDGVRYVLQILRENAQEKEPADCCREWAEFYDLPLGATFADLKYEVSMGDSEDPWGTCMHAWFTVADELYHFRSCPLPYEWQFSPGALGRSQNDVCDSMAQLCAVASDDTLLRFGAVLDRWARAIKHAGKDY